MPTLRRAPDEGAARTARQEADWFWAKVRERFPHHIQGSLLYEIDPTHWVVVVAEPPPGVQLGAIGKTLGATNIETRDRRIGHDGWVRDAVAVLSDLPRAMVDERLVRLEALMFGTSYRARPLRIDQPGKDDRPPVELFVSPWELHDWIAAADSRFVSLDGLLVVTGQQLLEGRARGVFRSETPGLVLWALPADVDFCDNLVEARTFLLESDLPVGALRTARHGIIAGRERIVAPEVMPPLRVESLLALASAPSWSLGQSFQRLSLFAGKLPSGYDWAPIFLSDVLVDTEIGSLLNITDQLLKSWSLNGTVDYANFSYPKPARWAADRGVMDELRTQMLTFNWNTKGIAARALVDRAEVITIEAGGALPITYLPEGAPSAEAAALERRNRRFFSELRDPNLTRVTAYAGMYQVLKLLGVKQSCRSAVAAERTNERSLERRTDEFVRSVQSGDAALSAKVSHALGDAGVAALARLRTSLGSQLSKPEAARREFIHDLGGVTGPPQELANQEAVDAARAVANAARSLAVDPQLGRLFDAVLDRRGAQAEFQEASAGGGDWLHTPTLVLSRVQVAKNVYAVGGHNLYVLPTKLEISPDVTPHHVRITQALDEPTIVMNEADRNVVGELMPIMKDVLDRRISTGDAEAKLQQVLEEHPSRGTRAPSAALTGGGGVFRPFWDRESTIGLSASRVTGPADAWEDLEASRPREGYAIRVIREADQYTIMVPGPTRWLQRARTDSELFGVLRGHIERPDLRGKDVALQFEGFERENVRGVLGSLAVKAERSEVRLQTVHAGRGVRGRLASAYRTVLGGPRDVVTESVQEVEGANGERLYQYGFKIKERTLFVRIALYFKTKLSQAVVDKIRAFFAGYRGELGQLSKDLDVLVRESAGTPDEVRVWIEDHGDDLNLSKEMTSVGRRSFL